MENETEIEPIIMPEDIPIPPRELKASIRASVLKEIVNIAYTLGDELKIHVNGGFDYTLVDPSDVAIIRAKFPKNVFEEYHSNEFEMGIDLDKMKAFLKNAKATTKQDDIIHLEILDEKNRIECHVNNVRNRYATVDTVGMSDHKLPNLNLPNQITLHAKAIQLWLKNNDLSDHLIISIVGQNLVFSMVGDTDDSNLEIPLSTLTKESIGDYSAHSLFSIDYFKPLINNIKDMATIEWGTDYPISMSWNVAEHGEIEALLAPRIESDD